MAGTYPTKVTLADKLMMAPVLLRAVFAALVRAVTFPFLRDGAPTYLKDVVYAALRSQLSGSNIAQDQWSFGTTDDNYVKLANSKGFKPNTLVLPGGTRAHWLGKPSADKIVLYFHGGGYVLGCNDFLWLWLFEMRETLTRQGGDVAFLVLSYTLAPQAQYPAQMKQGVQLVRHALGELGRKPSDVILAGDSAGGNLTLAIASHVLHPHPAMPPLSLSAPLAGAALFSPWAGFDTSMPAFISNQDRDAVSAAALQRWSRAFLGRAKADEYSEPVKTSAQWWEGLTGKVVKDVFIWGGGNEVLLDGVRGVAEKIKKSNGAHTTVVITPGGAHDEMILESKLPRSPPGRECQAAIESWLLAHL